MTAAVPHDASRPDGLSVQGVTHSYGAQVALRQVDLTVPPGCVCCLVGPSGSGKSTLLRLIAGLEPLQQGSIRVQGRVLADAHDGRWVPPERRPVGMVFQDYALFPHLDVAHNVAFGLRGARKRRLEQAQELLASVDLLDKRSAMPHTLSGGEQQRVALARALARRPDVMLLDEPFSGLDARLREEIREFTLARLRRAEVATLIVTHDPREALLAGDLVAVIQAGRLEQTGTAEEVYRRSLSLRVAETFGPVNRLVARYDGDHAVQTVLGRIETERAALDAHRAQRCQLLLRPEALVVHPADAVPEESGRDAVLRFPAEVESQRHCGSDVELTLLGPEQTPLQAIVRYGTVVRPGHRVVVEVCGRDAILVPLAEESELAT